MSSSDHSLWAAVISRSPAPASAADAIALASNRYTCGTTGTRPTGPNAAAESLYEGRAPSGTLSTMKAPRILARWIGGSAVATLLGLGFGGFLGLMGLHEEGLATTVPSTVVFAAAIAVTVGLVQGGILAAELPGLSPTRWAAWTGLGAIVAWAVIAYPLRLLTAVDAVGLSRVTVVLTAAAIGLAGGGVVATAQWFELRRHVDHAGWSIPSLAVAWMVGAVVILVPKGLGDAGSELVAVSVAAAALLLTGAVVASIQGAGLVRILRAGPKPDTDNPAHRTRPFNRQVTSSPDRAP